MAPSKDVWPERKLTATVVDTDQPEPGAWSGWASTESSHGAWPTRKKPQRAPHRPRQPRTSTNAPAHSRPVGRWIVATALWTLAGGLFAGRAIATHVDRGVEIGMDWLVVRGPSFLRPHLPQPVPKLIEPRAHRQSTASPAPDDARPANETTHGAGKKERSRHHR